MMNNKSSGNSGEDIVLNPNGETYNPISLNPFVTLKLICCLIGIPLNVTIAVTILRHRRLRCKPRNIFLLGITLSFLTFFIPAMIELVYRILLPIDPLCRAYVAFVGLPHGLLLFNMSLALTDRFVAINYPLLHREKMTARFACGLIVFSSVLLVFLLKLIFNSSALRGVAGSRQNSADIDTLSGNSCHSLLCGRPVEDNYLQHEFASERTRLV
jgi:hypothetical protein